MALIPKRLAAFRQELTGDHQLDRAQRLAQDLTRSYNNMRKVVPLLDGVAVKSITFAAATSRTVQHNLGRAATGYIVTRNYGTNASVPWEPGTTAGDPLNQIVLQCATACTLDFWFF